jgi:single-stranded-DNA-specific exonuclease
MLSQGLDLQVAATTASEKFGGAGGGHRIAAGAFIPRESEQEFVHHVNNVLAGQCTKQGAGHR